MQRADCDLGFLLKYENVAWYENGKVRILDRRVYPIKTEYVICETHGEVAQAIADMVTQSGGPAAAASMGMVLAAREGAGMAEAAFLSYMEKAAHTLANARPTTAGKMSAITGRALDVAKKSVAQGQSGRGIANAVFEDGVNRLNEHYSRYEKTGGHLCGLIPFNGTVMTQCYAETVIGMLLRGCRKQGRHPKFICPETRPYYQGARLTASLIHSMGFDVTVISDNMSASAMKEKHVDIFTSAADVICMDGHIVNKTGTLQIALAARHFGIPYFVTGTPNKEHPTIGTVTIEERDPELVLESMGQKHTMQGVKGYYPAFDITPPKLCDGVVTDKGVFSCYSLGDYFGR